MVAISSADILLVYAGFFLYGTGLAGSFVLREVIWANFFGRISLGTVRGLSLFFSHLFAASGRLFSVFFTISCGSTICFHNLFLRPTYLFTFVL